MATRKGKHSKDADWSFNEEPAHETARAADRAARASADASADAAAVEELIMEAQARAQAEAEEAAQGATKAQTRVQARAQTKGTDTNEPDLLGKTQVEADDYRDRFLRLQAEWDNFRKRTLAEREQERRRASEDLVERLLPVVDDLERAIEHSDASNENSLKAGIVGIYNKLNDVLSRVGVEVINPVGEAFDAVVHQAVGKVFDKSVLNETVTEVYQKGYQMPGRTLRTAMVIVSEGGPDREVEPQVELEKD